MRNLPPDQSSANLSRGRRLILPAFIFFVFLQFCLVQIILMFESGSQKQTVKSPGMAPIIALASSPNDGNNINEPGSERGNELGSESSKVSSTPVQGSGSQPVASQPPGEEVKTPAASVSLIPREEILYSVPAAGKKAALTFDDGPSYRYTPEYLRVLREYRVHATFFLVGKMIQNNPNLLSMIAGEGHEVANHTYDHLDLKLQNEAVVKDQLSRTSDLIMQWTQQEIKLMRPPGGSIGPELKNVAAEMDLQIVMWTIDPRDWEKNKTSDQIIAVVKNNMKPGAIILLHEGKPQTLAALPTLINDLQNDGWEFVTISELINEGGKSI